MSNNVRGLSLALPYQYEQFLISKPRLQVMLIKSRGIVFRAIKYSETSLIVDIYTEERGLRKYIVSGVRSAKARTKASLLQVMSLVDLVAYHREDRDLNRLREIRPALVYQALPFDVRRSAVGQFITEVARKTIRESEENRALFDFLFSSFEFLDVTDRPITNLHLHFLIELSTFLGFVPGGECTHETPFFDLQEGVFVHSVPGHPYYLDESNSRLLHALLHTERDTCHQVKMTVGQRRALLQSLLDYYRLHLEHFPEINAHHILQEVLEG